MTDPEEVSIPGLVAFANQNYHRCAQLLYPLLPRTVVLNIHVLLICLQRLGHTDAANEIGERCLSAPALTAWDRTMFLLTLGRQKLEDVLHLADNQDKFCEAHCYGGSALLTNGEVDAARASFQLCLDSATRNMAQALAHVQLSWPEPTMNLSQRLTDLNQEFVQLHAQEKYEQALDVGRQTLELAEQHFPDDHADIATLTMNVGVCHFHLGDPHSAKLTFLRALEAQRKVEGGPSTATAKILQYLAQAEEELENPEQARLYYLEAGETLRSCVGEEDPLFEKNLDSLIRLDYQTGNLSDVLAAYRELEPLWERRFGKDHPDYLALLQRSAEISWQMDNPADTVSFLERRLEILRDSLGDSDPQVDEAINQLAHCNRRLGNFAETLRYNEQLRDIRIATAGESHPKFAEALHNLGVTYFEMDDAKNAIDTLRRALTIEQTVLGEDHRTCALTLNSLGAAYQQQREYAQAEEMYKQAITIRRRAATEGPNEDLAISLNNLAALYSNQAGKEEAALELLTEAEENWRQTIGEDNPGYGKCLTNIAFLNLRKGDFAAAASVYERAVAIQRRTTGSEHPDLAFMLMNLAVAKSAAGFPLEAFAFIIEAAEINLRMIAQVFSVSSEGQRLSYLRGVKYFLDAVLSLAARLPDSPERVKAAWNVVLQRKLLNLEAMAVQRLALRGQLNDALREKLSELTALRQQISDFDMAGPLMGLDHFKEKVELITPGLTLEELKKLYHDGWNMEEYKELLQESISAGMKEKMFRLAKKQQLEKELARAIPEKQWLDKLSSIDFDKVATTLPADVVLIEFMSYREIDFESLSLADPSSPQRFRYAAFVLHAGQPDKVQFVPLGDTDLVDTLIGDLRNSTVGAEEEHWKRDIGVVSIAADRPASSDPGADLYSAIFSPLIPSLKGCRSLIISPDGELARLPFEILPTESGNHLIDDYQISYVAVGRDLMRFGSRDTHEYGDVVVIADPDYDYDDAEATDGDPTVDEQPRAESSKSLMVSRQSAELREADLSLSRLSGTRVEGQQIGNLLGVKPWVGKEAIKSLVTKIQSPRILHVATHGFFLENPGYEVFSGDGQFMYMAAEDTITGRLTGIRIESPLLRSGLALAGANVWLRGDTPPFEAEDGLLTAEDISSMELSNTQLVVLSACDTGLGEIRRGEGVLGLRHVVAMAGARTLVMSLWKVPDLATTVLMERFYDNLLHQSLGCAEALREAQLYTRHLTAGEIWEWALARQLVTESSETDDALSTSLLQLRSQPEETQPFLSPLYWGAFICEGDPRPI